MRLLMRFMRPYRGLIAVTLLVLLIDNVGTLLVPTMLANMVNTGITTGDVDYILRNGLYMLIATGMASGGAVLGAPLAHDFCVISLSDRLTPWTVIEKRLACAAMGDFCAALYNPSSKGRADYLQKAVRILLQNGKAPQTICGIVRNIGREGQAASLLTLAELENTAVDMFTTVYIGNAATRALGGKMVTPRGYRGV